MVDVLVKVRGDSNPHKVAGMIDAILRRGERAEVRAIGAGAVNQAAKSIAISRVHLQGNGIDAVCTMDFADVDLDGKPVTAIVFLVVGTNSKLYAGSSKLAAGLGVVDDHLQAIKSVLSDEGVTIVDALQKLTLVLSYWAVDARDAVAQEPAREEQPDGL